MSATPAGAVRADTGAARVVAGEHEPERERALIKKGEQAESLFYGVREPDRERGLIRRAQAGEVAAYEELVRKHQQRVLAIVGGILRRSEDVEDVAQQVFFKVYMALKRFDLRSAFSTWLYKVAVNECWDYLRKKRVRRLVYEADLSEEQVQRLEGIERGHGAGVDAGKRAELREAVEWLLGKLGRDDRAMMVLKEVEGFSVNEIGEMVGLNVNTVKVRLFRARRRMVEAYRKRQRKLEGRN